MTNKLEERIVRFCAPVLTGIKTGGLFNTCEIDPHTICKDTVAARKRLRRFGIDVRLFFTGGKTPLVYVYRPDALARTRRDHSRYTHRPAVGDPGGRCCRGGRVALEAPP